MKAKKKQTPLENAKPQVPDEVTGYTCAPMVSPLLAAPERFLWCLRPKFQHGLTAVVVAATAEEARRLIIRGALSLADKGSSSERAEMLEGRDYEFIASPISLPIFVGT